MGLIFIHGHLQQCGEKMVLGKTKRATVNYSKYRSAFEEGDVAVLQKHCALRVLSAKSNDKFR